MVLTSKYEELAKYLANRDEDMLRMTFEEVARIVGSLPQAAYDHRAWWANSFSQNHAMNGWLNAGWKTSQVDMDKKEVDFVRAEQLSRDLLMNQQSAGKIYRKQDFPRRDVMNSELEGILGRVGGLANLSHIVDAIERYMRGDMQEMELGQILRRFWHGRR